MNGGLLLAKDLARIQDTVRRFKLPSVDDRFETLRQFSNIYVVLAENLKPLLDEGLFARLDPRLLHSFIVKRADYKQAKLAQLFHGLGALAEEEECGGGAGDEMTIANVWEKGLGNAVEAMGDAVDDFATDFATVGEGLKRMLQFPPFPV